LRKARRGRESYSGSWGRVAMGGIGGWNRPSYSLLSPEGPRQPLLRAREVKKPTVEIRNEIWKKITKNMDRYKHKSKRLYGPIRSV